MEETKVCSLCKTEKLKTEFSARKSRRDGLHWQCKPCKAGYDANYRAENAEHIAATSAKWRAENTEHLTAYWDAWYAENVEHKAAYGVNYRAENTAHKATYDAARRKANPAKINASNQRYQASKLLAIPGWTDHAVVDAIYLECTERARMLDMPHHVDHIIPLRSKLVCGLHTEHNLRVIPAAENNSKGNRHWPDMPVALYPGSGRVKALY